MVAIANILLLAVTAAAAVIRRDPAAVLADLKTIDSDTNALTSAVNSWNGQLFTAIPINNAESKLDSDIKSATGDANNSQTATETEAQSIIDYINSTLEPDISKAITALENKKASFKSSGLYSTVQGDLRSLKTDTDSFGSALIAKAPATKQSAAKAALAKIDSDFAGAQASFS